MLSERLSCLCILSSEDLLCSLSGFWHTKWNISGFTVARLCHNQHFAHCTEQQKLQLDLPPQGSEQRRWNEMNVFGQSVPVGRENRRQWTAVIAVALAYSIPLCLQRFTHFVCCLPRVPEEPENGKKPLTALPCCMIGYLLLNFSVR